VAGGCGCGIGLAAGQQHEQEGGQIQIPTPRRGDIGALPAGGLIRWSLGIQRPCGSLELKIAPPPPWYGVIKTRPGIMPDLRGMAPGCALLVSDLLAGPNRDVTSTETRPLLVVEKVA
jgi:hypothetical protein